MPLLLYSEGKSYEQIVEAVGVRKEIIESQVCVAKAQLRKRLRDYLAGLIPARR